MSEQVNNNLQVEDIEKARFMAEAEHPSRWRAMEHSSFAEDSLKKLTSSPYDGGGNFKDAEAVVKHTEKAAHHLDTAIKVGDMAGNLYDKQH